MTRGSGHSLDEPAQALAPVSLAANGMHVHTAQSTEMARTSPPSSAGRGCWFGSGWLGKANAAPTLGLRTVHECLLLLVGMPGTIPQHPRLCGAARCRVAPGVVDCPRCGMRGFGVEAKV